MTKIIQIRSLLKNASSVPLEKQKQFFKTGVGDYAEHDQFNGVPVPILRKVSKEFKDLTVEELSWLLESPVNEERLLALFIMIDQYQKASPLLRETLHQFYKTHLTHVNNWNLVDASAPFLVGMHLMNIDRTLLLKLARSESLWERRIAIVSTWHFIRQNDLEWTFRLAEILLKDSQDLIHKAVGWMLREAGKRDEEPLISFLEAYKMRMPRTMLRYAIEKFSAPQRAAYLLRKKREC